MGALSLLVTGAAGYVGRATVEEARARGHRVVALVRRDRGVGFGEGVETRVADLVDGDLDAALRGVDVVIHCAASLAGSDAEMRRDTVVATERLMRALARSEARRMVLVGSMAVYGASELAPGSRVDEDTPLETRFAERDAYCRAKLAQEEVAAREAVEAGRELWILRAGAVWGPGRLDHGHLGVVLGPLLLRLGAEGEIPLVHRDHCAEALVRAAETPTEGPVEIVNVLDDERPDRLRYLAARGDSGPILPLSWRLFDRLAGLRFPRAPGLLRRPVLRARMMPLEYTNRRLHERLGWRPRHGFEEAMAAAKMDPAQR